MDKIIEILEKLIEAHKVSLDLVEQRIEAIKKEDYDLLESVVQKESQRVAFLEGLEKERLKMFSELGFESLTLYTESLIKSDGKAHLFKIRNELIDLVEDIKSKNEISQKLIKILSGIADTILKDVTKTEQVGYNNKKEKNIISSRNLVNRKV